MCGSHRPKRHQRREEKEEAADAQLMLGRGGDTEARQHKTRREKQHHIYF
jgi:hypothetical protein